MRRLTLLALVLSLGLAACVPTETVREPPRPEPPPAPRPAAPAYPAYETFDPSGYDAAPPAEPERVGDVDHDVPEILMAGTIAERPPVAAEASTVQGFRIQVFSSESKPSADRVRDEFAAWWRGAQAAGSQGAFPYGFQASVEFIQPYYRVRGGAFATRDEAEDALELVRERFPEAFLVPDTVTLRRTN